jgi:hypothetical protein
MRARRQWPDWEFHARFRGEIAPAESAIDPELILKIFRHFQQSGCRFPFRNLTSRRSASIEIWKFRLTLPTMPIDPVRRNDPAMRVVKVLYRPYSPGISLQRVFR